MESSYRPTALLDGAAFEGETAALAALANLWAEGPASARTLIHRIDRAARTIGEPNVPFKHATIYAVLHELEFEGAVTASGPRDERPSYAVTGRGRDLLSAAQRRWRSADLILRAASAPREKAL